MLEEYQGKDDWMTPAEKISTNYAFTMFSRKKGSSGLNEYLSNKQTEKKEGIVSNTSNVKFDAMARNMANWISKNPIHKDKILWRAMSIEKDIWEKYKKIGYIHADRFVCFSESENHAKTFLKNSGEKINLLIKFHAKKGNIVAPPYRKVNGYMIGYPEEQEFQIIPGSKLDISSVRRFAKGEEIGYIVNVTARTVKKMIDSIDQIPKRDNIDDYTEEEWLFLCTHHGTDYSREPDERAFATIQGYVDAVLDWNRNSGKKKIRLPGEKKVRCW